MHRNSQYRGSRQRGADDFDDRSRMQHGDERSGPYGATSGNYEDRDDARFDPAGDRRRSSEEYYGGRGQGGSRYGEDERGGRAGQRGYDYGEREYDNDYTSHGHEGGGYGRSERDSFPGTESGGRGYGHEPDWSRGPHGSYGVNRGERSWQGGAQGGQGGSFGRSRSFAHGSSFGQGEASHGVGSGYGPSGQSRDFSTSGYEPGYGGEEYAGGLRQGRVQGEWSRYGGSSGAGQAQKRGPKGWQRSDERVKEDICERLYHNASIDSSEVTVDVSDGKVSLEGTVPDRRMKHAVEDLIDACPGVKDIDNRIRVQRPGEPSSSTATGSASTQGGAALTGSTTSGASAAGASQSAGRDRKE